MAIQKYPYESLEDVVLQIKNRAQMDISWLRSQIPYYVTTAEQLFYFLSHRVIYRDDPPNVELLQRPKTLLTSANYWGVPGMGDCDCFSILSLGALQAIGFPKSALFVVLTSKYKDGPEHIFISIKDRKNYVAFDLTNPLFNFERSYPYKQIIPYVSIY